jgi:phage shock protein E
VDGAINIPVDEVASRVGEFNKLVEGKDKKVVLYCRSGRRSAIAANVLRDQGFEVVDVGPMSAW